MTIEMLKSLIGGLGLLLTFMDATGLSERLANVFSQNKDDAYDGGGFLGFVAVFLIRAFWTVFVAVAILIAVQVVLPTNTVKLIFDPIQPLMNGLAASYNAFGLLLYIPLFLALFLIHYLVHFFRKYPKGFLAAVGLILAAISFYLDDILPLLSA
jgi:flagellar biosynthesis protein FlhB